MTIAPAVREVRFAECWVSPEARAGALDVLAGGWLTTGRRTHEFEAEFARAVDAPHAVAVSSCTAALELALRALRLDPGSPVLTPTLTFCGAVHAIVHAGLRPVFVDSDPNTLVVDEKAVSEVASRTRPSAFVVQHMAGYPAPVAALAEAAGLPLRRVVEDAAHGLGASRQGLPIGATSTAACFSFYATKNLPIGEGGAITTVDAELADQFRVTRQHGMDKDAWRRYEPGGGWRYGVEEDGLKANFTDLQAAIGLGQLAYLPKWQRQRERVAALYDEGLANVPGIVRPVPPADGRHAWHLYVVRIGPGFGRSRDEVIAALTERGIGTSVHFQPVHRFGYFRRLLGEDNAALPVSDLLAEELLSLPMHPHLSDEDVAYVCEQLARLAAPGRL